MPTNYPASLDTTTELPAAAGVGANLSTFPHSTLTGNVNDAVRAIEAELGVAPSDTYSTVKARLDAVGPLGAWTAYTPTWVQSVTITKTVNYARYMRVGRTIIGAFHMTASSAGTTNNTVIVGLPIAVYASAANNMTLGPGYFSDASAANYTGALGLLTSQGIGIITNTGYVGVLPNLAIAAGDIISGQFMYEANA